MSAIINGLKEINITIKDNIIEDIKNQELYNKTTNHINEIKLKECQDYANSKNGFCLSEVYIASREKMIWKCDNKEHPIWLRSYEGTIKNKTWCPKCKK